VKLRLGIGWELDLEFRLGGVLHWDELDGWIGLDTLGMDTVFRRSILSNLVEELESFVRPHGRNQARLNQ
jgi:hypothetical protein